MSSRDRNTRRACAWLLILIAFAALSEIAAAFQPGDPPYTATPTYRRRQQQQGPTTPAQ